MWKTPIQETVVCADFVQVRGTRTKFRPARLYLCKLGDPEVWRSSYSFGADFVAMRGGVGEMLEHIREGRRTLIEIGFRRSAVDRQLTRIPEYRSAYGGS
ncbi:MAG: hypothetical protein ACTS1Z_15070 [Parasphingopyxis sp.]|uniref:hypothetical protein n=1 Tax=Parasphingopyxis sp. TaxID=1920299 RepID=UPI003F9F544D